MLLLPVFSHSSWWTRISAIESSFTHLSPCIMWVWPAHPSAPGTLEGMIWINYILLKYESSKFKLEHSNTPYGFVVLEIRFRKFISQCSSIGRIWMAYRFEKKLRQHAPGIKKRAGRADGKRVRSLHALLSPHPTISSFLWVLIWTMLAVVQLPERF